ncbi:MAG TPA: hypothetical protein VF006_09405 [Longimicrobium sp.]
MVAALPIRAQDDPLKLENLKTPTSPAFVILGVEPTSVERPTTPRAFALSLYSASQTSSGVIPENYAAEFAPFWMRRQPQVTWESYFEDPTPGLAQTFSVSLATKSLVAGADSSTGVGIGIRATPVVGHASARADSLAHLLDDLQDTRLDLLDSLRTARIANNTVRMEFWQGHLHKNATDAQSVAEKLQANDERVGLRLELAGALAGQYPGNDFQAGKIGSAGAWGTVAYRLENPSMDLLMVGRYLRNKGDAEQNVWDVGGRAVLLYERFSGSVEWVARSASDPEGPGPGGQPALESGNRVVGLLEYRATDDLYVSFSFGQDYPREGDDRQPLVAILGGQFNFGSKPLISLPNN